MFARYHRSCFLRITYKLGKISWERVDVDISTKKINAFRFRFMPDAGPLQVSGAISSACTDLTVHTRTEKIVSFFKRAEPDKHRSCVWSGIVTQVPFGDLSLAQAKQRHEPLAFISGRFSNREYRWSILEKEVYVILATVDRMHWALATTCGFDLFTDHNNLIFIFDPLSIMPDLSQSSLKKVLRWAVRMSIYNYTCVHISGEENVWADLLGW